SGFAGISPPVIDGGTEGSGDHGVTFEFRTPVIPSAASNRINPKAGTADAVEVKPVVRGSAVEIASTTQSIDRMEGEAVGRKPIPHELSENRIVLVNVVAGANNKIPVRRGFFARWDSGAPNPPRRY